MSLGQAEKRNIGQWQIVLQAWTGEQSASDSTWFSVVGTEAEPETTPSTKPAPESAPPETQAELTDKVNASNATELLALIAMRRTEGLLTADPNMDANEDGQVTLDDVRLILQWAVKGESRLPSPSQEEEATEAEPGRIDAEALLGKWEMTRISIQPAVPVPDFVVNWVIPKKATWEIFRDHGELKIKYGGRDTWYKKTFLKGITEGPTTVQEGGDGLSCILETQGSFYLESIPIVVRFLLPRKVEQIKGTFTSKVSVSISGDELVGIITVDNVDGTYYGEGKDGQMRQKPINFEGAKITYQGVRKE